MRTRRAPHVFGLATWLEYQRNKQIVDLSSWELLIEIMKGALLTYDLEALIHALLYRMTQFHTTGLFSSVALTHPRDLPPWYSARRRGLLLPSVLCRESFDMNPVPPSGGYLAGC